jgi:Sulfotransferase domain
LLAGIRIHNEDGFVASAIPFDAYAIIIGAMKAGTSSFYHYLAQHPQICPAKVKEPEFFSEHQRHKHPCENYSELWEFDPQKHRVALEASTGYTKFPYETNVPKKIFDYGVRPKLIYCVRNPFERIISQYEYSKFFPEWGPQDVLTEQAIHLSSYFFQLQQFRRYFSKEKVLLLDFDEITRNPQTVVDRVFDWLELPSHTIDSSIIYNKTGVTNESGKNLRKTLDETRYRLTPAEKERVLSLLKEDMMAFQREYNFDVSKWGF